MKLIPSLACAALALLAQKSAAQGGIAGTVYDSLRASTPRRAATYKRVCPGAYNDESAVVIGRVRDVDDQSLIPEATVTAEWTEVIGTGSRAVTKPFRVTSRTNSEGVYVLCGLPSSEPMLVHAEFAGVHAGPIPFWLDDRMVDRANFGLSRRDSAALLVAIADTTSAARAAATASLRGRVVGDNGRPMRDAAVALIGAQGSVHTDSSGAFRIDRIPAGTRTIVVRYIGLLPVTVPMDFATNAARDTLFSIGKKAQALRPVEIRENAGLTSWMERNGFEDRRKMGLGAFVTEQDVRSRNVNELIDALEGVRGVHVSRNKAAGIGFPEPYFLGAGSSCTPNYFLDGVPFNGDFRQLTGIVPPHVIKGIEVYSSRGTIPALYDRTSSTGCGSIAIWTR